MNLNKSLYRKSGILFAIFFLCALIAFWPSYYGRLLESYPLSIHVHGIAMTTWCLMLISQALLIRYKKFSLHRFVGKTSFLLVPLILVSGTVTAHDLLSGIGVRTGIFYSSVALMFNSLVVFAILYGLAIYHRKKPLLHARYMVATIFPIFTPITDRLVHNYFPSLLGYLPTLEGVPQVWMVGFFLADLLLLGLVIWDWRTHQKSKPFLVAFGWLIAYHLSVLVFHRFSFWRSLGDWILELPLS